jgi:hypothetical protein
VDLVDRFSASAGEDKKQAFSTGGGPGGPALLNADFRGRDKNQPFQLATG